MQVIKRPLTEEKVLKRLNIEDFRHLTKDKVITLATMLDKMDPEVAKKALEQFPEFASTMKTILSEYKQTLDNIAIHNNESVSSYYQSCDAAISFCKNILEKDELSFEEKEIVLNKIIEIVKMKGEKDSENKKFLLSLATKGCATVVIIGLVLLSALGGSSNIKAEN